MTNKFNPKKIELKVKQIAYSIVKKLPLTRVFPVLFASNLIRMPKLRLFLMIVHISNL